MPIGLHIVGEMTPQQQKSHRFSEEGDFVPNNNSVALEIGKDFLLPDSNVMADSDDPFIPGASSTSSSPQRSEYQSQLHPSDEENSYIVQCRREKNRRAAQKCREKKKERIRFLESTVKDLNHDIRTLKCKNSKLEEEKERLAYVLKLHKRYCPLKEEIEDKCANVHPVEEKFNPNHEHMARPPTHHMYTEQSNIQTSYPSYLYQTQPFATQ